MNYTETIEYLLRNTSLSNGKVYNYEGEAGEEYFDKMWKFYSGNLVHNKDFGANPSYVVFYNKNEIYAEAKKSNKHFIVAFDKGIVNQLSRWYGLYFDFENIEGLEEFVELEKEINFKISTLLEQAINHFTFYHEFAHLIQYVAEDEFEREDYLFGNCDYNLDKHIEEYDADIFSGICVATHIFQFIDKYVDDNLNDEKLNNLIAITLAGILVYILSLPMCKEEFYTEEGSHPHSSVRVNNLTIAVINHFEEIVKQEGNNIKVDRDFIVGKSHLILKSLLPHFGLDDIMSRFAIDMTQNWDRIVEYHNELYQRTMDYKNSAIKKWNLK